MSSTRDCRREEKLLHDLDGIEDCIGWNYTKKAVPIILAYADKIRREAIAELATKIADWPEKYTGPAVGESEAESYYEIMEYCYNLIGREWK